VCATARTASDIQAAEDGVGPRVSRDFIGSGSTAASSGRPSIA